MRTIRHECCVYSEYNAGNENILNYMSELLPLYGLQHFLFKKTSKKQHRKVRKPGPHPRHFVFVKNSVFFQKNIKNTAS